MSDFDLNDMVDFFAKDKNVNVLVFDEEGVHEVKDDTWVQLECELCSKVASWKREEGIFCEVSGLDLWIVQLDDLIQHALRIRDDNVMKYKTDMRKAFEMGINMLVLLMKEMIKDMVVEKKKNGN